MSLKRDHLVSISRNMLVFDAPHMGGIRREFVVIEYSEIVDGKLVKYIPSPEEIKKWIEKHVE